MGIYKTPSEGGSGGRRGHSNMDHWTDTEEIKSAARVRRRQHDKASVQGELEERQRSLANVRSVAEIERLPRPTAAVLVHRVNDEMCAAIAQALPHLQILYQDGSSSRLSDEGVSHLATLLELRELDLEWAVSLTDTSLSHLRALVNLEWLDLSFCSGMSEAAIRDLQEVLSNCEIVTE